ncbi:MAG: rod shape-determining protein MreD [Candidatus Limnocylindria bacterium]
MASASGPAPYTWTRRRPPPQRPSGDLPITYLSPLLAVIVGIVHAAIAPVIVIAGVKPSLVLVAVVVVTALFGFVPGVIWAFVAGLTANLLVGEPLGSVPLVLLLVTVLVAAGARAFGGLVWIYPVVAAFAGSVVADLASLLISQMVTDAIPSAPPADLLLRSAALNAATVALLLVPARALAQRYAPEDAPGW